MSNHRVIFLNSIFPVLSETFLFNQYRSMRKAGLSMKLVSSHRPTPDQLHPGMEAVQSDVDYLCDARVPEILLAHLWLVVRHPLRYLIALWHCLWMEEVLTTSLKHISGAALVLQRYGANGANPWIHSHFTYGATAIAYWIKQLSGLPYSITLHGSDLIFDNPPDLADKLGHAEKIICISRFNSDYVRAHFPSIRPDRLVVLSLGVQPLAASPERSSQPGEPIHILNVGRLSTHKAQEYLIRACARLRDEGYRFRCTVVGEGPLREFLEAEITRLELQDTVELTGAKFHKEVLRLYSKADMFVLSSAAEGMPIVLMEAMQAGVPVVATSISGIPELLDDGQAGVLVPPSDDEALAEAMKTLIQDDALRQRLSERAIDHIAEGFDQETNALRFKVLLESCMRENG